MSSYKKRQKALKRTHRERGQLLSRQHLGLLEKHKDHVLRAKDYQQKKNQLKRMHEKARNRNPDEFYYKMVNTRLKGGRHVIPQDEEKHTPEELQLMKTQDLKYIQMKLATERKKVERLQSCLHQTKTMEARPPNTHTIFVDSIEEAQEYECCSKTTGKGKGDSKNETVSKKTGRGRGSKHAEVSKEQRDANKQCYKELKQRTQRCKQLSTIALKMKTQKELMGKGHRVKVKSDGSSPAVYKWKAERKK